MAELRSVERSSSRCCKNGMRRSGSFFNGGGSAGCVTIESRYAPYSGQTPRPALRWSRLGRRNVGCRRLGGGSDRRGLGGGHGRRRGRGRRRRAHLVECRGRRRLIAQRGFELAERLLDGFVDFELIL